MRDIALPACIDQIELPRVSLGVIQKWAPVLGKMTRINKKQRDEAIPTLRDKR